MEFDPSKENIQPLRGGRNVTQLEMALHAQTDTEFQKELLQQKEKFEEAIRTYEGDDPLDDWYSYISWVEQSYPKHGHEGNLIALLEDCLSKFENDERYIYDRRICKLWIKFIDLQQNPLELLQVLHSKGICVACADLYRAWAYYYEVSGDYKRADAVFQLGIQALAQPYEELVAAHQNFFGAIGKQAIHGVDERRLAEQRHAMTSLRSYTHKHRTLVTSNRTGSQVRHATPGTVLKNDNSVSHNRATNVPVVFYVDPEVAGPSVGTGAASISILTVARQQNVHKENTFKPTQWNLKRNIITPKVALRTPVFKIHEDEISTGSEGIKLPPNFAAMNKDDFSNWKPDIYYAEVPNPNACPMYPKSLVYGELNVEYSPEEIRARLYHVKNQNVVAVNASIHMQETTMEDANIITNHPYKQIGTTPQSMKPATNESILAEPLQESYAEERQGYVRESFVPHNISAQHELNNLRTSSYVGDNFNPRQTNLSQRVSVFQSAKKPIASVNFPASQSNNFLSAGAQSSYAPEPLLTEESATESFMSRKSYMPQHSSVYQNQDEAQANISQEQPQQSVIKPDKQWLPEMTEETRKTIWPNNTLVVDNTVNQHINDIWNDDTSSLPQPIVAVQKPQIYSFKIHEDTKLTQDDAEQTQSDYRNSLKPIEDRDKPDYKASRFSVYSDPIEKHEQTPTPSLMCRKSLKTLVSSQPLPEREREFARPSLSQNFVNSSIIRKQPAFNLDQDNFATNINDSCTTQTFNMNAHVRSTPVRLYKSDAVTFNSKPPETTRQSKKVLFDEDEPPKETSFAQPEKLSIIMETTKEYGSSSSSSSSGLISKTIPFNNRESLQTIQEFTSREEPDCPSITQSMHFSSEALREESPQNYNKLISFIAFDSINAQPPPNVETDTNLQSSQTLSSSIRQSQTLSSSIRQTQNLYDSVNNFIDLTEETDVTKAGTNCLGEIGGGDASNYQIQSKANFKFSTTNDAYNYESNDSMSSSPVKGSSMDVDVNHSLSRNLSSEYKMDYNSCSGPVTPMDETTLQNLSDPFASTLKKALLKKVHFPKTSYAEYFFEQPSLPRLSGRKECVALGVDKYMVDKVIGKGAFGSVYRATNLTTKHFVALKCQKPPDVWEFYIMKEIRERLVNSHMLNAFMNATYCFTSRICSILVSDYYKLGSLLDLTNKVKQASTKGIKELVAIYFASEIITIVNTLHQCRIIHGDIKPDNFLVTRMPPQFGYPSLQLIDYGCSIDMTLFPQGTTFTKAVSTENFTCTEMKDGRSWTYQTDIFCVAATIHVLLFEKYMQLKKNNDVWLISQRIPRYMRTDLWNSFFFQLLNIASCDKLPDLNSIKAPFDTILSLQSEELQVDMRYVANCVLGR